MALEQTAILRVGQNFLVKFEAIHKWPENSSVILLLPTLLSQIILFLLCYAWSDNLEFLARNPIFFTLPARYEISCQNIRDCVPLIKLLQFWAPP